MRLHDGDATRVVLGLAEYSTRVLKSPPNLEDLKMVLSSMLNTSGALFMLLRLTLDGELSASIIDQTHQSRCSIRYFQALWVLLSR